MYLFYIDDSGTREPCTETMHPGSSGGRSHLYVLSAVSLFEHQWHKFDASITEVKRRHIARIEQDISVRLTLADCEIKSNWIRRPKERAAHPYLGKLSEEELHELLDAFYTAPKKHHMEVFAVVVDKRSLYGYMDSEKIHKKAWEILCEMIHKFMEKEHRKHQAVLITDDVQRQMNQALAMKHAYLLENETSAGLCLDSICEMPMFVRSELSNGVQLADLFAYNTWRAFLGEDLAYPYFARMAPFIHSVALTNHKWPLRGIQVFPAESTLQPLRREFERMQRSLGGNPSSE
ncbi:MAG: DUF3800 domain-containing protein [Coriobacteriia bacterium]